MVTILPTHPLKLTHLYSFAQITCCRSKTAALARRKGAKREAIKSRFELFKLIYYSKGPYYLWKLYIGEAVDFVLKILQLQVRAARLMCGLFIQCTSTVSSSFRNKTPRLTERSSTSEGIWQCRDE